MTSRTPDVAALFDAVSLRRQESRLILLNLAVLSGIAAAHVLFVPALGTPGRLFFVVLLFRVLMQTVELICLQNGRPSSRRILSAYANVTIWLHVGFAFLLSRASGLQDAHYVVLMIIPVIAAGFRYRTRGLVLVITVVTALTILEVWLYFRSALTVRVTEYFEAANVALIYIVVGTVVALLSRQLRKEQRRLSESFEQLQITRDRLVEEEKLAAIGRLASSVAHEIRNPVAMILSSLAMSGRGETIGLSRSELDSIIEQEATRLERLVSDFLIYARQTPPDRSCVPLVSILGYARDLAQGKVAEAGLRLRIDCDEEIVVEADVHQLHRAVLNLVSNAIEATPPGGEVVVRGLARPEGIAIAVENPGEPVPPEIRSQIFEPFFTTRPAGTGLGLAIARSIARSHHGDLFLASNEPGRILFEILLPLTGTIPSEPVPQET
ncbi:MAG: HAMP domain-containing sensor histidine kinase [Thermoanaerobaculia bacterium]